MTADPPISVALTARPSCAAAGSAAPLFPAESAIVGSTPACRKARFVATNLDYRHDRCTDPADPRYQALGILDAAHDDSQICRSPPRAT
jgi:hypothetical protein